MVWLKFHSNTDASDILFCLEDLIWIFWAILRFTWHIPTHPAVPRSSVSASRPWQVYTGARRICPLCLKASDQKLQTNSIEKMEKNRAYRVPKEVEKDTKIVKIHSSIFLDLFGHPCTFVMDFSYDTLLPQRHFHHMWRECHVKHPPPIWRSNSRAKKPHRVLPGDWAQRPRTACVYLGWGYLEPYIPYCTIWMDLKISHFFAGVPGKPSHFFLKLPIWTRFLAKKLGALEVPFGVIFGLQRIELGPCLPVGSNIFQLKAPNF